MSPAFDDDEALRWLARSAHIRPDGSYDALGVLREELKRHHLRVSRLHAKLFYQPLLESLAPEGLEFSQGMTLRPRSASWPRSATRLRRARSRICPR